jgi:hypothetical protein
VSPYARIWNGQPVNYKCYSFAFDRHSVAWISARERVGGSYN